MHTLSVFRVRQERVSTFLFETNTVRKPKDAADIAFAFLKNEYGSLPDREVFGVIWVNTKNIVVGLEIVSVGILNAAMVRPREVFMGGLLHNASSGIVFHNHPSGITNPSTEDIEVSKRLISAGELLSIHILDSLVLGEDSFTSLQQIGLLD
ncbi:JAB domain-containing protein [Paenibacillus alvei]|uniref:JAB domain-containing protein n=1 Tax=Paenibacillus alvei TaxID=44250 RepID=UPI00227E717E|nr:JAB domain-containing protein [Paenibacillus alvei]